LRTFTPIFAIWLCASCATAPAPLQSVRVETLPPVIKIVTVPCLNEADVPPIPPTALNPASDVKQLEQQARIDIDTLRQYAIKANALLIGCTKTMETK